jgi:1-acyl-sn-glycerol-3-phosphate acyltransferase
MAEIRNIASAPRRKRPGASRPRRRAETADAGAVGPRPSEESLWHRLQEFGNEVSSAAVQHLAPGLFRDLDAEIATQIDAAPLATNDFGFDPWGFEKDTARRCFFTSALLYRYYFRVQTRGIENLPPGRVLLIGNHAGQIAIDAAMIATACLMEGHPPRIVRGMGEYWLSRLPWLNVLMVRFGSVVGTPKNCVDLLEHGEAVLAFPEGVRGMNKGFSERYQLQDFGLGFLRLALQTGTPIVPVATVGSEEQAPSLGNFGTLARMLGIPAFPMVLTPIPLPVRYHVEFGEPLIFEGSPHDEDHVIEEKVNIVKARLRTMLRDGRERRTGLFT